MKEETSNYQSIKYKDVLNFETEITVAEVVLPLKYSWRIMMIQKQTSRIKITSGVDFLSYSHLAGPILRGKKSSFCWKIL